MPTSSVFSLSPSPSPMSSTRRNVRRIRCSQLERAARNNNTIGYFRNVLSVDATLAKQLVNIQKSIWCSSFQVTQHWVRVRVQILNKSNKVIWEKAESFLFTRWQQQFAVACFRWRGQISFPAGGGWWISVQHSVVEVFKQGTRMWQDDRQTTDRPRYGEMRSSRRNRLR